MKINLCGLFKKLALASLLSLSGLSYGQNPISLYTAAKKGDLDKARSLLEGGANPNEKDRAGWTALHLAVQSENLKMIELLLEYGADLFATDRNGMKTTTPLNLAYSGDNETIIKKLLEYLPQKKAKEEKESSFASPCARSLQE